MAAGSHPSSGSSARRRRCTRRAWSRLLPPSGVGSRLRPSGVDRVRRSRREASSGKRRQRQRRRQWRGRFGQLDRKFGESDRHHRQRNHRYGHSEWRPRRRGGGRGPAGSRVWFGWGGGGRGGGRGGGGGGGGRVWRGNGRGGAPPGARRGG